MEIELGDLEWRLGSPVPTEYGAFVFRTAPAVLKKRGFDPKTLCVLNLNLRDRDKSGMTRDRFFLSGDGCGNYYFVSTAKKSAHDHVLLWSHDPPGIEDPRVDLTTFLESADQWDAIYNSVDPDTFCITRADDVGESILNPISLDEWKQAISACEGIRYQEYSMDTQPFTEEPVPRMTPGQAVAECNGAEYFLYLRRGRIEGEYSQGLRPLAEALAKELKARLVVGPQ